MAAFKGVSFDPDEGSRRRLKAATQAVSEFETVAPCATYREATQWVARQQRVDLVFISEKAPAVQIRKFINEVKQHANCSSAVFVIMKASSSGGLPVSEALLLGADGVLCEPFSVDNLLEVVALARRLGKEREMVKSRIAMTLLVTDILNQIDTAAYILRTGSHPKAILKSLRGLGRKLAEIPPEKLETYYHILARLSAQMVPVEHNPATPVYHGASDRVRRNTELKLWKEIAEMHGLLKSDDPDTDKS